MILYIASAIIFVFIALNLFWRTDCPIWLKIAGSLCLLLVSLKYEIYRYFGHWFFAPHLPAPVLITLETLYGAFIILFFLLIFFDLYLAGNWILARAGMPTPARLPLGAIKCGLVAAALGLGIFGTWQAVKAPDVRTVRLQIANLPEKLENFSIVQLSDIHIGPILKKDWLAEVVARTNAAKPDLIALTGDYVDGYADQIGEELAPLANLAAPYGVLAVTGNHEYYWDMPAWRAIMENMGVKFLENTHQELHVDGATLVVAGIPDLAAGKFGQEQPDARKALANAPQAVRILLSHRPFEPRPDDGKVDLVLSGHTHGGIMFFLQPLIARFNDGFVDGLYSRNDTRIYVSPGTGLWNGFSSRLGVPAEITRFVLTRGEKLETQSAS